MTTILDTPSRWQEGLEQRVIDQGGGKQPMAATNSKDERSGVLEDST
jgi:hypothetical protein